MLISSSPGELILLISLVHRFGSVTYLLSNYPPPSRTIPPPSSPLKVTVAPRCVAMMQQQQQQDAFVSFSIRFITRARLAFTRQTFFSPIDDCSPYDSFAHVASISDPQVTYVSPGEATCDRLINEFTASWTRVACFSFFFVFFFQLTRDPQSVVCHDRLSRYFRLRPDITIPRAR